MVTDAPVTLFSSRYGDSGLNSGWDFQRNLSKVGNQFLFIFSEIWVLKDPFVSFENLSLGDYLPIPYGNNGCQMDSHTNSAAGGAWDE